MPFRHSQFQLIEMPFADGAEIFAIFRQRHWLASLSFRHFVTFSDGIITLFDEFSRFVSDAFQAFAMAFEALPLITPFHTARRYAIFITATFHAMPAFQRHAAFMPLFALMLSLIFRRHRFSPRLPCRSAPQLELSLYASCHIAFRAADYFDY
jgi:hypothetical protein